MAESVHWEGGGRRHLCGWAGGVGEPQWAAEHHTDTHSLPTPNIPVGWGQSKGRITARKLGGQH